MRWNLFRYRIVNNKQKTASSNKAARLFGAERRDAEGLVVLPLVREGGVMRKLVVLCNEAGWWSNTLC